MDTIKALLTTREGRISRRQWWMGVLILIAISILVSIVLGILTMGNATLIAWAAVAVNIALIWPNYCLGLKRRHDRNNEGRDLEVLIAASVVVNLIQASGIGATRVNAFGVVSNSPSLWLGLLNLAFGIFAIYMVVQLGFLRGTTGPNRFGPDPLDAAT